MYNCVCVRFYVCVYVCLYVCVYVCLYVCVCAPFRHLTQTQEHTPTHEFRHQTQTQAHTQISPSSRYTHAPAKVDSHRELFKGLCDGPIEGAGGGRAVYARPEPVGILIILRAVCDIVEGMENLSVWPRQYKSRKCHRLAASLRRGGRTTRFEILDFDPGQAYVYIL